jgi:hypothetical protein
MSNLYNDSAFVGPNLPRFGLSSVPRSPLVKWFRRLLIFLNQSQLGLNRASEEIRSTKTTPWASLHTFGEPFPNLEPLYPTHRRKSTFFRVKFATTFQKSRRFGLPFRDSPEFGKSPHPGKPFCALVRERSSSNGLDFYCFYQNL